MDNNLGPAFPLSIFIQQVLQLDFELLDFAMENTALQVSKALPIHNGRLCRVDCRLWGRSCNLTFHLVPNLICAVHQFAYCPSYARFQSGPETHLPLSTPPLLFSLVVFCERADNQLIKDDATRIFFSRSFDSVMDIAGCLAFSIFI